MEVYRKSTNTTTTKACIVHSRSQKIRGDTENSANTEGGKIQSRKKGKEPTRFDLAQESHQAVEQVGKQTGKVGQKKKTDSISNKKFNPTWIELKRVKATRIHCIYRVRALRATQKTEGI